MQAVLTSLVFEGVFERFPKLRVVIMEGAGLDSLAERTNGQALVAIAQRSAASEATALGICSRAGVVQHAADGGAGKLAELIDLFDRIGWDRLLFSTDYPHWDFDDPRYAFKANLSEAQRDQLLYGNSRSFYGLR